MTDEIYAGEPDDVKTYGDPEPEPGALLKEKSDEKVAKLSLRIWEAKNDLMRRREAQWEVNELRRAGWKNVQLRQESDDRSWKAWVSPASKSTPDAISAMNKAASLCRKFISLMFADPPGPLCAPATGEDEDRDAAEFSTRVLDDVQSVSKLNDPKQARRAFDRASTFGSGFVRYFVHPTAGGRIPIQISAGPFAQTVDDALKNPETGQAWDDLTERFVRRDGTLTEDVAEAATRTVPALKSEVLTGRNVRMIPHTAEDIAEADGVQVAAFRPWGEIRRMFGKDFDVNEEDRDELLNYKPKEFRAITTPEERRAIKRPPDDPDERLAFTLTTYYTVCDDYPKGAYVVTVGDKLKLTAKEWTETDDEGREISLMLPLTQYKQWAEGTDDPYGFGMMDLVGEGNELRSHLIGAMQDHIDWLLNRKIFLPISSILRPQDLRLPGKTPIPINPGGKPEYEDIPAFPRDAKDMISMTAAEMEADTSLGQVAQGLESSKVQSGRHAQAIISQVHAGLSEIRQNIEDGYVRGCEIQLQLIRAFYDAETRIGWVGEDGAYKEKHWSRADLRQTTDVKLKPGTLTMLSPIQKTALAEQYMQMGVIPQEDFRDVVAANLGGTLGIQDEPFALRVRRQIAAWMDGPPEEWEPEFEEVPVMQDVEVIDPQTGLPAIDPETDQPMMEQQPVIDPETQQPQMEQRQKLDQVLGGIWRSYPADELPYVARTRLRELAKAMQKSEFAIKPPEWQFGMIQELSRMQVPQEMLPGQQVGQPPNTQQSPAQRTQGPLAPPDTPVPTGIGEGTLSGT